MRKAVLIPLVLLIVLLGGLLALTCSVLLDTQTELSTTKVELKRTQSVLGLTEQELETKTLRVAELQNSIDSLAKELEQSSQKVLEQEGIIQSLEGELEQERFERTMQVNLLQNDIASLKESINLYRDTFGEVYPESAASGFRVHDPQQEEGRLVNLIDNKDAVNPTWGELRDFLLEDKTDTQPYIEGSYICGNFTEDVHNNAEEAGIRAAVVLIGFEHETDLHAVNAFKTTDKGLVFIDCTGAPPSTPRPKILDRIVTVKLGKNLKYKWLSPNPLWIFRRSTDLITIIRIYW